MYTLCVGDTRRSMRVSTRTPTCGVTVLGYGSPGQVFLHQTIVVDVLAIVQQRILAHSRNQCGVVDSIGIFIHYYVPLHMLRSWRRQNKNTYYLLGSVSIVASITTIACVLCCVCLARCCDHAPPHAIGLLLLWLDTKICVVDGDFVMRVDAAATAALATVATNTAQHHTEQKKITTKKMLWRGVCLARARVLNTMQNDWCAQFTRPVKYCMHMGAKMEPQNVYNWVAVLRGALNSVSRQNKKKNATTTLHVYVKLCVCVWCVGV